MHRNNPILVGTMLTILTNLSLNDQNNIKIRLYGAHILGSLLMENCPTYNQSNPKKYVNYILTINFREMSRVKI